MGMSYDMVPKKQGQQGRGIKTESEKRTASILESGARGGGDSLAIEGEGLIEIDQHGPEQQVFQSATKGTRKKVDQKKKKSRPLHQRRKQAKFRLMRDQGHNRGPNAGWLALVKGVQKKLFGPVIK